MGWWKNFKLELVVAQHCEYILLIFSAAKSHPTLCESMDYSTPGFPVLHYLLEFAQIHVHRVGDIIEPSHPLLPSSPLAFNLSQHSCLFQWAQSLHQVGKVLELQLQSFQWISRVEFLEEWLVWSACSPTDSQESSPTPQFKRTNSSAFSLLYSSTFTCIPGYWKTHSFDHTDFCQQSDVFAF